MQPHLAILQQPATRPDYTTSSPERPATQAPAQVSAPTSSPSSATPPKTESSTLQPTPVLVLSTESSLTLSVWAFSSALFMVLVIWAIHAGLHIVGIRRHAEGKGLFKRERRMRYHFWAKVFCFVQLAVFLLVTLMVRGLPAVRRLLPAGDGFANMELLMPGVLVGTLVGIIFGFTFPWGRHIRKRLGAND